MVNSLIVEQGSSQFKWKRKYQTKSLPFANKIPFIRELIINNIPESILKKVYLFGSYAYGNPTSNSDIDIYVVIDDNYDNFEIALKIKRIFRDNHICPCDLIVKKEQEFEEGLQENAYNFTKIIYNHGVILYGKR
jgi:predicted nucleotidyltransferase